MKYRYRCTNCHNVIEREETVSEHMKEGLEPCPKCGGPMAEQPTEPNRPS